MSERNPAPRRAVPAQLERVLATEVSLRARLRHLAVGLAGGCGAALIAVLWATEPNTLPTRTQAAFAVLIAIGLAWAVFAGWVLSRRRPLFARDQVLSARIALAATVVTASAGVALAATRGSTADLAATAAGGVVVTAAAMLALVRARRRRRELLRLRDALQPPDHSDHSDHQKGRTAMNNKTAPIGPLALALRLRGASNRTVLVIAALTCAALLIGVGLLLT